MRGRKRSEGHFLADSFISEGAEGSEKGWMRLSHSGSHVLYATGAPRSSGGLAAAQSCWPRQLSVSYKHCVSYSDVLGLSSTEVFFFIFVLVYTVLPWFNRSWNRWKGFLRYVQKGPEVVCVLSKGADTSCEISHACTDFQAVVQWLMCEANSRFEKQDTWFQDLVVTFSSQNKSQVTGLGRKGESERRGKGEQWGCFSFPTLPPSLHPSFSPSFSPFLFSPPAGSNSSTWALRASIGLIRPTPPAVLRRGLCSRTTSNAPRSCHPK